MHFSLWSPVSKYAQYLLTANAYEGSGHTRDPLPLCCSQDPQHTLKMKDLWKGLPKKVVAAFESLKTLFESNGNFALYRAERKVSVQFTMLFVTAILTVCSI